MPDGTLMRSANAALTRAREPDPLVSATAQLLERQKHSERLAVVWFSNRPGYQLQQGDDRDHRLISLALAAGASISLVRPAKTALMLPPEIQQRLLAGYTGIARRNRWRRRSGF